MANRRKLTYLAGFIALCWIATAALIGIFVVLVYFLKSTTALIVLFLVVLYSCLFGLLGWQVYTWKGRRDGWASSKRNDRGWGRSDTKRSNESDEAEDIEAGWK